MMTFMMTKMFRVLSLIVLLSYLMNSNAFTTTATTKRRQVTTRTIGNIISLTNNKKSENGILSTRLMLADPSSMLETMVSSITTTNLIADGEAVTTYSKASYYTILALYLLSFPGLYSTVKRSTKAKIKRQTFVSPGENSPYGNGKALRQQAGEIMAYMKANNYEVKDAGETIKFQGIVQRSLSQAFFLVFCTALGMISFALVLQIQFNDLVLPLIGKPNWYLLTLFSPYAGLYYWQSGDRVDDCEVKLVANDDETENEITVQGSEEELERMWRTLEWNQKGMVKIPGLLESQAE